MPEESADVDLGGRELIEVVVAVAEHQPVLGVEVAIDAGDGEV